MAPGGGGLVCAPETIVPLTMRVVSAQRKRYETRMLPFIRAIIDMYPTGTSAHTLKDYTRVRHTPHFAATPKLIPNEFVTRVLV